MFFAALFTIAKTWKQPKCPLTDEWIKERWYLYTMGYYSAIKKNAIRSNMDGTRDSPTEWNESERQRQKPYDITYAWNLIYGINEPFHRKENHGLGEQTCGFLGGDGEGVGWIGSLGLTDANYCFWSGLTMRSCCVALRTMSRYLQCSTTMGEKIMYTYICNWVPILYSGEKKVCWGK